MNFTNFPTLSKAGAAVCGQLKFITNYKRDLRADLYFLDNGAMRLNDFFKVTD